MQEVLLLLDEVTDPVRVTDAPRAELEAVYRALADQRAAVLHERWSSAGGFAGALRHHEERPRHAREIHS